MKLENKVAIITGSTRGIGRATAELFAKEGAKVVVVGTKEELGAAVVEEIRAAGGEAIFCKTDVTSDESLEHLVNTTKDTFGKYIQYDISDCYTPLIKSLKTYRCKEISDIYKELKKISIEAEIFC